MSDDSGPPKKHKLPKVLSASTVAQNHQKNPIGVTRGFASVLVLLYSKCLLGGLPQAHPSPCAKLDGRALRPDFSGHVNRIFKALGKTHSRDSIVGVVTSGKDCHVHIVELTFQKSIQAVNDQGFGMFESNVINCLLGISC